MTHVLVEAAKNINIVTESKSTQFINFEVFQMDIVEIRQKLDKLQQRTADFRGSL